MKNRKWLYGYMAIWLIAQLITQNAFAQEATSSAADEEKAKQIREAVQEKIKAYSTGRPSAFVGTLKTIANSTLTIETKKGLKQASTSAETTFLRISQKSGRKEIEFSDLGLEETVIALGYLGENKALEVKKLIVSEEIKAPPKREIIFGAVTEIEESVLTVKNPKNNEIAKIEIQKKTKITMKNNGEIETIEAEEIGLDSRLIAICEPAENNKPLNILRLHLLRQ